MDKADFDILSQAFRGDFSHVTDSWMERMRREAPFIPVEALAQSRRDGTPMPESERREALGRLALALGGTTAAQTLASKPDDELREPFYPSDDTPRKPSTEGAIDKFLATFGREEPGEIETLERLIFNPVADYAQQLAAEARSAVAPVSPDDNSQDARISRFILSSGYGEEGNAAASQTTGADDLPLPQPQEEPRPAAASKKKKAKPETLHEEPGSSSLSESLARVYIKTGRYERAYEILNRLSLAVPEKNAYFADQLLFLRKLMLLEGLRNKRNASETTQEN